ncbi:MAG: alpha/beta hydrolase [Rhodospirillaceae bacterium]|jgi:pimeloyl-ACP methyl ester carboxylesterase|nr:alpha/beta hydrolase [Rhodospirillaceae bacterium]MBT5195444.1 alpha/beta hydrolase [Rhodospirillaceae bacterium]MBT5896676.1 alpha/beta hydrolase [Rhodospirillaceae bacterium]MBT6428982.1 alpha/beta hydrolase [Rhodospirillaceae bacterium]
MDYSEHRFRAQDGLELYYRDYGDRLAATVPVLCLAGLTRNTADFHDLALHLCGERRVISMDLRGRGRSAYDPNPDNYAPPTYMSDIGHLLTVTGCHKVIVIGTSLGGLLAMALGAVRATALAGVVINDIGPEIDPKGVARISGYAGKSPEAMTLEQAGEHTRQLFGPAFPDYDQAQWQAEAQRGLRLRDDGLLVQDYDPAIARNAADQGDNPMGFWPYFNSLAHIPTLAIRGELSDILSTETFAAMAAAKPDLLQIICPNRGHAPDLSEPECLTAIDSFLKAHGDAVH